MKSARILYKKRKKFKRVAIPACHWHIKNELGYLRFFEDCEKRDAKGQRQIQCPVCGYWFWPDKFGIDPIGLIDAGIALDKTKI